MKLNDMEIFKGDARPVNICSYRTKITGWEEQTQSGEGPLAFENTYNDKADLTIGGNSVQAQTEQNKNLALDIYKHHGLYVTSDSGQIVIRWASELEPLVISYLIPITPGTTYTFKKHSETERWRWATCTDKPYDRVDSYDNFNGNQGTTAGINPTTVTAQEDDNWLVIYYSQTDEEGQIQVEIGDTATDYVVPIPDSPSPYYPSPINSAGNCNLISRNIDSSQSTVFELPLLRKVGDVADTYNPATGEYIRRIGIRVFDGTESFIYNTTWLYFYADGLIVTNSSDVLCTHFISLSPSGGDGRVSINATSNRIFFSNYAITSISDFKAWLADQYAAGTPITVFYQLEMPIVTQLTPEAIKTYYPSTIIEQDGEVLGTIEATVKVIKT